MDFEVSNSDGVCPLPGGRVVVRSGVRRCLPVGVVVIETVVTSGDLLSQQD